MKRLRNRLAAACAIILISACASAPSVPKYTVELRLLPGQSPVADIDGPYAAFSRIGHGVLLRVWPDSTEDGTVDLSIVVRNTDPESIAFSISGVTASGEAGPVEVLGQTQMLARFDSEPVQRAAQSMAVDSSAVFVSTAGAGITSNDGAVKLSAPTSTYAMTSSDRDYPADADATEEDRQVQRAQVADWYLNTLQIAAGEAAVGGIGLVLPDAGQTIIVTITIGDEKHDFALLYERQP